MANIVDSVIISLISVIIISLYWKKLYFFCLLSNIFYSGLHIDYFSLKYYTRRKF